MVVATHDCNPANLAMPAASLTDLSTRSVPAVQLYNVQGVFRDANCMHVVSQSVACLLLVVLQFVASQGMTTLSSSNAQVES